MKMEELLSLKVYTFTLNETGNGMRHYLILENKTTFLHFKFSHHRALQVLVE